MMLQSHISNGSFINLNKELETLNQYFTKNMTVQSNTNNG